ncbi:butyrophilin subfamily 1 member A1-like isoform X2 [Salvelinus sp. IW2-2015]|uniref:butyrophilin subfamily 1 member A1-like isoform X2 n=1 Tax=Salvelinus sp. IW2-2015 TaxID=2691554 RepID=UPI000CEB1A0B|nr:butyrophilin subfamily 1 member A1-like isoform X2 [Salvelinus alpinus]
MSRQLEKRRRGTMHSGVFMRVLILSVVTDPIPAQNSEIFTLVVPHGPILTRINASISLPCELSPIFSAEPLEVRWYRPGNFNRPALLYKDHSIQASVDPRYWGRVSLTGGLERGNVSLRLDRVTLEDRGEYVCRVSSEQWYEKASVSLTLIVLGGIPVLSLAEARGGGGQVNVTCSSVGWSPQPTLTWKNKEGAELRNVQEVLYTHDSQGLVSVSSWLLYSPSDSDWLSCTVSLSEEEEKESRILPRAPMDGHWSLGAFITTLIILLLVVFTVIGLFIWNKKTDKTESTERPEETALVRECGMQTAKETTTQKKCVPKAWGEVKRFKVDITLDPTSAHPNLDVYAGRKKVYCRDSKVTDVPTALHVFSEDRFSSGQSYWEVKVREDSIFSKEKQSWYVGVATDTAVNKTVVVPLTPENGFWVLTCEKEKGYYVHADPQMPVSGNESPLIFLSLSATGKAILTTLGVFFDCDRQMLSFYDAESKVHLYSLFNVVSSNTFLGVFSPGLRGKCPLTVQ